MLCPPPITKVPRARSCISRAYLNLSCMPTPQLRSQGVQADQADQPQGMGQGTESHVTTPSRHTLQRTQMGLAGGRSDEGKGNLGQGSEQSGVLAVAWGR